MGRFAFRNKNLKFLTYYTDEIPLIMNNGILKFKILFDALDTIEEENGLNL